MIWQLWIPIDESKTRHRKRLRALVRYLDLEHKLGGSSNLPEIAIGGLRSEIERWIFPTKNAPTYLVQHFSRRVPESNQSPRTNRVEEEVKFFIFISWEHFIIRVCCICVRFSSTLRFQLQFFHDCAIQI